MTALKTSLVFLLILGLHVGNSLSSPSKSSATATHEYQITQQWDSRDHPDGAVITVQFLPAESAQREDGFILHVEAPFYDDPRVPEGTPPGRLDGLWEYEVIEVFLLGDDETYLEIEVAPGGNFLVYYLEGVRNATDTDLLIDYVAKISENRERWEGTAFVPWEYLPPGFAKFNAYAIHKSDPDKIFMSLFPVPVPEDPDDDDGPDFHNLQPFQDIDLSDLMESDLTTTESGSLKLVGSIGVIVALCSFSFAPIFL